MSQKHLDELQKIEEELSEEGGKVFHVITASIMGAFPPGSLFQESIIEGLEAALKVAKLYMVDLNDPKMRN